MQNKYQFHLSITILILSLLTINTVYSQDTSMLYTVTAESGLIIRDAPNLKGNRIGKFHVGMQIEVVEITNKPLTIYEEGDTITGHWVKVFVGDYIKKSKPDVYRGYVFNGYLRAMQSNYKIDIQEITKTTYDKIRADIPIYPQSYIEVIEDIEQVKKELKDRIWFDEDERLLKLKIGSMYGGGQYLHHLEEEVELFFTAYFPDKNILLLEGGHGHEFAIDIVSGYTGSLVGNPYNDRISKNKKFRLIGTHSGQECINYSLQEFKRTPEQYGFETILSLAGHDICNFESFIWISGNKAIYSHMDYSNDAINGEKRFYTFKLMEN